MLNSSLRPAQPFVSPATWQRRNGPLETCRVAVVHEWITGYAGSERVVEQILSLFPHADLYLVADFLPEDERGWLQGRLTRTTFIQHLPFARKSFRNYLPLMPLAVEALDLSEYDVILSSSHAVAKGVLTGPDQLHICYCHTPIRYAWDLQHQYLREAGHRGIKAAMTRAILHYMRLWDSRTAHGVDLFLANSHYIARRIQKVYGRSACVVHPPVDLDFFQPIQDERGDYFLTASRLVPYKRTDIIVEAFSRLPDRRLVVVGEGPQFKQCQALAGPNVEMVGYQSRDRLLQLMQGAKAFLFAAEEDFGISIVEAQACGTPVICFGRGGAVETVVDGETGLFFSEQTADSIIEVLERFDARENSFSTSSIRRNAERFSSEVFRRKFLERVISEYTNRMTSPNERSLQAAS